MPHIYLVSFFFYVFFLFLAGQTVLAEGLSGTRAYGWHKLTLTVQVSGHFFYVYVFLSVSWKIHWITDYLHIGSTGAVCIWAAEWIPFVEECCGTCPQEWLGSYRDKLI